MHMRRDGRVQCGRPRLEACRPVAETFGVHEDFVVWRTRGEHVLDLVDKGPSLGQGLQTGPSPTV